MTTLDIAAVRQHIANDGIDIQSVCPNLHDVDFPTTYTVGLTEHDHPELVLIGLPGAIAHMVINRLAHEVLDGHAITPGLHADVFSPGVPAAVLDAAPHLAAPTLPAAAALYGDRLTVRQVCFPDHYGHWPWEPESHHHRIPLLGAAIPEGETP